MLSFGLDLSHSASKELGDSFVGGLPYLLLVLMVTATSYYQQRQISARNKGTPVNPQQQMLMRVLPAFFAFISLTLPSGLVLYFFVSNLYRIVQQAFISHRLIPALGPDPRAIDVKEAADESSVKGSKDGKDTTDETVAPNQVPAPKAVPKPAAKAQPKGSTPAKRPAAGRTTPRGTGGNLPPSGPRKKRK
jgi:YidC/Oxa1 family membrane protein insertase